MDANYSEHEMELLSEGQRAKMKVLVENPTEDFVANVCGTHSSDRQGGKKTLYSGCFLTKMCVKCVAVTLTVCAFLFLAYGINKIQNKIEVEAEKLKENTDHVSSQSQALESSELGVVQLAGRVSDKEIAQQYKMYKDTGRNQISKDDEAYRKHVFNIGMRQDNMMQNCLDSSMKHSFPDIDYAFLGYDVFRGYPLADEHDPGFTFPIFDADYSHGKQTADCRYSVPKGFLVVPDVSCVTSFSSEMIQTVEELARSLSFNAEASGGGFGVSFSASAGFKRASSDLNSKESVYILSTAHCNYYISKFLRENPPPFTQIFVEWIHKLNSSANENVYFDFFDTFGTHFTKEITFGARFSYEHKMKSSLYREKREHGFNVAAQASYNGLFSVSGGFSLTSEQREEASNFSKSVETRTVSVGAAPPANGDAMTWASTVQNNPVPSKYKLEPIEKLFQKEYMGNLGVDYQTMSSNIQKLKMNYYSRLIANKLGRDIKDMSNRWITKLLMVENGGKLGTWDLPQFCPIGTFASGVSVKGVQGRHEGSMLLNDVGLKCASKTGESKSDLTHTTQLRDGLKGGWTETVICPHGNPTIFLQKFAMKVQKDENSGNVSVNAIRFSCRDLNWIRHSLIGSSRAGVITTWSEECPVGSAVCGIQTRMEGHPVGDESTILKSVRLFCCGDDSAYLNGRVIF